MGGWVFRLFVLAAILAPTMVTKRLRVKQR